MLARHEACQIKTKVEKKMALLKEWHKLAYNENADQGEMQRFWTSYFLKEQSVYEKLLSNPDEAVFKKMQYWAFLMAQW